MTPKLPCFRSYIRIESWIDTFFQELWWWSVHFCQIYFNALRFWNITFPMFSFRGPAVHLTHLKTHRFLCGTHLSAGFCLCMFSGLSGLWRGQLRAVVMGSAADDGDDSAAYWPITLLSVIIAVVTDTDHPPSSGQKTFIIFSFSVPQHLNLSKEKYICWRANIHVLILNRRDVIDLQDGQQVLWF